MNTIAKQSFIRRIVAENRSSPGGSKILWSRHAIAELAAEGWNRRQVEDALLSCQVIEDYPPSHRPLPDCLALSWLSASIPIHVVVAIDQARGRLLIVTVYRPSEEEWKDDWRTRK